MEKPDAKCCRGPHLQRHCGSWPIKPPSTRLKCHGPQFRLRSRRRPRRALESGLLAARVKGLAANGRWHRADSGDRSAQISVGCRRDPSGGQLRLCGHSSALSFGHRRLGRTQTTGCEAAGEESLLSTPRSSRSARKKALVTASPTPLDRLGIAHSGGGSLRRASTYSDRRAFRSPRWRTPPLRLSSLCAAHFQNPSNRGVVVENREAASGATRPDVTAWPSPARDWSALQLDQPRAPPGP